MPAWSALLVQKIDLRVRGLSLRKLQVNRHQVAEVQRHAHTHDQAILYLSGEGRQITGSQVSPARTGDIFLVPAGCEHGFEPAGRARPICLVLDFDRAGARRTDPERRVLHRALPPAALNELHRLVSRLPRKGGLHLTDYATVLAVTALLFETRGSLPPSPAREPAFERVRHLLSLPEHADRPLAMIARHVGYQPDYLSRKLRRECGQSLRELRNSLRLESATSQLQAKASVAQAAQAAGFADPAYFARWFRGKLGVTPSVYRNRS